jgi:hypothetical protein
MSLTDFLTASVLFLVTIGVRAWWVERRDRRHHQEISAWFRQHVPPDEIPEHLRDP